MGEGDFPCASMFDFFDTIKLEDFGSLDKHVMITTQEYEWMRNQIKMYKAISDKLFTEFYGPDYYFSDPLAPVQVYYVTAMDVIKYVKSKKQNIFKRIWQKITKW